MALVFVVLLWSFFCFNSSLSVVLPIAFSNTDFEISSIYPLYFGLHMGDECSVECLVSPLQWSEVDQLHQRLLLSFIFLCHLPFLTSQTIISSLVSFSLHILVLLPAAPSPLTPVRSSSEAVISLSLFGLAERQNSLGCWLSTAEQGLLCTSI